MHPPQPPVMIRSLLTLLLLISLVPAGCKTPDSNNRIQAISGTTMGTTYQVLYYADPGLLPAPKLQAAIEKVLAEINHSMSTYQVDSEISRFNSSAPDLWIEASPAMIEVLSVAEKIHAESFGAFDPTVAPLVNLWGFGPKNRRTIPPPAAEVRQAKEKTGIAKIAIRHFPPGIQKLAAGIAIDLSAIAKGYAVDRLALLIEESGCPDYLVEIGGEIRAGGTKPDGSRWLVGIEVPVAAAAEVEQSVSIGNRALATSGDYRNFFEQNGKRYSHTIDPRTGYPVDHNLASVTVIADNCMVADGWATALLVLGPEAGYQLAREKNLAVLFTIRTQDGFQTRATPAFEPYLSR